MKKLLTKIILSGLILFLCSHFSAIASDNNNYLQSVLDQIDPELRSQIFEGLTGISISGQWFLKYQYGEKDEIDFNEFGITRGYITIKKTLSEHFSGRITPDITVDKQGDGQGDVKMRLKYCYLQYKIKDLSILSKSFIEFGIIHRPWMDFEQKINRYRVQGKMFFDRYDIVNSADFGIAFFTLLGGEVNNDYKKNVNNAYPGKYGSICVGVYNGGGYHAIEKNTNKTIEGRLSIRPFPAFLTGLQLHYHGIYGNGNTIAAPDWTLNAGFVSYENRYVVLTGTYFEGAGNFKGTALDYYPGPPVSGEVVVSSLKQDGFSAFAEIKFLDKKNQFNGPV